MKFKIKNFIIVGVTIVVLLLICLGGVIYFSNCNKIVIDPDYCQNMFEMSPKDFCKNKGEGTLVEDGYSFAKVDKNGYLILLLNDKELKEWKNKCLDLQILQAVLGDTRDIGVEISISEEDFIVGSLLKYVDKCGYEISEDYKKLIVSPDDMISFFPFIMNACKTMQMMSGTPTDQIKIEYIKIDSRGNIIEKVVWPDVIFQN
jgi:hypothetical protein